MEPSAPSLDDLQRIVDVIRSAQHCAALHFERGGIVIDVVRGAPVAGAQSAAAGAAVPRTPSDASVTAPRIVSVVSPSVGLLRAASGDDGASLPAVGDRVAPDATIAAIDVLGTLVPVVAPVAGRIAGILVPEGSPVGYGQTLVLIEAQT